MLFASGAAALVYQIIWVRQLSLVVGIEVFATTLCISSFFAGLAIGSWLLGNYAERTVRPVHLYALLELSIAISGTITTQILTQLPQTFVTLDQTSGVLAWGLPIVMVAIPATFMGGTLPVLVRCVVATDDQLGTVAGRLYAANTMGAIAGSLLTGYVLVPQLGIAGASYIAAALNLASAGLALFIAPRQDIDRASINPVGSISPGKRQRGSLGLFVYGIAGGIALGYEVVWSQIVVQWTSTRSFAFASVLAVYLCGLAIGGYLGSWLSKSYRDRWGSFAILIGSAGMIALLQMLIMGQWIDPLQVRFATAAFNMTGNEYFAMFSRFLVAAGVVMFVPAILLGAAFPFALLLHESDSAAGRTSGQTLAANTVGGIAGTLITGFILIPTIGIECSLATLAIGAAVIALVAAVRGQARRRWIVVIIGLVTVVAATQVSPEKFGKLLADRRKGQLIYHASGAGGTVAVIEQGHRDRRFRRLYIQGVSNSGDSMTSLRYMRLQALLPLIIHAGQPKSALVIGLGTGITAGSLLSYDGLDRRVCAELLPEVVAAAAHFKGNQGATDDPRLEIRLVDGRHELLRRSELYDLITLEPPPPSASGVANLYSVEFYQLARTCLEPNGLVAQWLPLPTQNDNDTRSLVRSFLEAFPNVSLWSTELHEMMLIGSPQSLQLDALTIQQRFKQPSVQKSLSEVGIDSPSALLSTYVCDRVALETYTRDVLPVTDDRPRIEYGPWTVPGEFPRTFRNLISLKSECELLNADETLLAEIRDQRTTLHQFYLASIAAYEGDRESWQTTMSTVMRAAPTNHYYRWFSKGGTGMLP